MRDTGTRDAIQVEFDFGSTPRPSFTSTVNDGRVSASSYIFMCQSGQAPTSKSADENEMDVLVCSCTPAAGSFTVYVASLFGPVVGRFKFHYVVR